MDKKKIVVATMHLFFQNVQKRSLMCREHGTLQTCDPLWAAVRLSVLQSDNPIEKDPAPGMHWATLWVWALEAFTSTHQGHIKDEHFNF